MLLTNLRVLHPRSDLPLFHVAWEWRAAYPRLVRRWDMVRDFEQWLELMRGRVSVGVFMPYLSALVTLEPVGRDVYEVHVDCERGVSKPDLLTALLSMRRTVFEQWGAREVFVGVVSRNYGIIRLAGQCGFTPDGITERVGSLTFIRLRMTASEYKLNVQYQNQHFDGIDHQHLHASAGSIQP